MWKNSRISSAEVTIPAPWRISSLHPLPKGSVILPCSRPQSAVIREPLLSLASTTITTSDRPLMIRLRMGKFLDAGGSPGLYSERIPPFLGMSMYMEK